MLEQQEADYLLGMAKIYSTTATVDLSPGTSIDHQLEGRDGTEFFWLDIWSSSRNNRRIRFQLRARRTIILARLCTASPHTNPDGQTVYFPHLHRYREGYEARWAEQVKPFDDPVKALEFFCNCINLPMPDKQGGLS